jgi:hypothetical protein
MPVPVPLRPDPPRVLIVEGRFAAEGNERGAALESLFASMRPTVEVVRASVTGHGDQLPDPRAFGAVVVDGSPVIPADGEWPTDLRSAVERGASVLALVTTETAGRGQTWLDWLGVKTEDSQPFGEWFVKVVLDGGGLADRVPAEFPIEASPVSLASTSGDAVPVLQMSIAFTDCCVMLERRVGNGRVIVSGLGGDPSSLAHRELATILRRCLASVRGHARRERPTNQAPASGRTPARRDHRDHRDHRASRPCSATAGWPETGWSPARARPGPPGRQPSHRSPR